MGHGWPAGGLHEPHVPKVPQDVVVAARVTWPDPVAHYLLVSLVQPAGPDWLWAPEP